MSFKQEAIRFCRKQMTAFGRTKNDHNQQDDRPRHKDHKFALKGVWSVPAKPSNIHAVEDSLRLIVQFPPLNSGGAKQLTVPIVAGMTPNDHTTTQSTGVEYRFSSSSAARDIGWIKVM